MKLVVLAAFAGLSFAAAPVLAAEPTPPAAAAAAAPSAHQLELARQYVEAAHMQKNIDAILSRMSPLVLQQMEQQRTRDGGAPLPSDFVTAMSGVITDWARERLPAMTEVMVQQVAEIYTEKELTDLIAFYQSPTGQAVLAKAHLFSDRAPEMMAIMKPPSSMEMLRRTCKRYDCTKLFKDDPELKAAVDRTS
jgi:hypothetical protein